MAEISRVRRRFPAMVSGTLPETILSAIPSATAVFPTPGSPIRQGLFFVLRDRIWMTRMISASLPMTGSRRSCLASAVRSREYWSSIGVLLCCR